MTIHVPPFSATLDSHNVVFAGIAIERYFGVFHSLRYPEIVTTQRINLAMAICVIYSTIVSLGPMLGENDWYPGELMMTLRRYLTSIYDRFGRSRLEYRLQESIVETCALQDSYSTV